MSNWVRWSKRSTMFCNGHENLKRGLPNLFPAMVGSVITWGIDRYDTKFLILIACLRSGLERYMRCASVCVLVGVGVRVCVYVFYVCMCSMRSRRHGVLQYLPSRTLSYSSGVIYVHFMISMTSSRYSQRHILFLVVNTQFCCLPRCATAVRGGAKHDMTALQKMPCRMLMS